MPHHILFLCHPDHGHVIPNLAVVAELAGRGHRVSYLTAESMAELTSNAGATTIRYDSRYKQADFHSVARDPWYLLSLLLDESARMLDAAEAELGEDRPDLIVYDTSILHAGRILARKWGVPAAQLIPMFASNESFSYLNAMFNPDGAEGALPGWVHDMLANIAALAARHGVDAPPQELWWEIPDFSLVNIPREFQYAGDSFDERFAFVGPCVGDRGFLGSWEPPGSGLPVALVSFGAVFNEHPDFFRTCVRAFTGAPFHAVMTVADGLDPAELGELPSNVEVHRWVPHVAVLAHASAAVTHGGMGTVMESLHAGRPMVVIPTSAIDAVTARRIAELGLGVTMDPAEVTAERLVAAVRTVIEDDAVRAAAERMRGHVHAAGGTARAAGELEKYLTRSR
ncbi:macrolide family glycosyltransferase [Actinoalloteichus spitiensis]|uniref:macrolide family glycosyltransferase n=1 Tax=Actinoalloteichus spitiensis TaxID=252394 RepID=UPI0003716573|nr:macrolide family glycosyltransferase [Actinoalloteichus spitiensis]